MNVDSQHCSVCQSIFEITAEDLVFYKKVSPSFGGVTIEVPPPKLCPDCREQRRLSMRNDRVYYSRACDLCEKKIISLFDPKRTQNVYCLTCWWSDNWDPLSYGKKYDFSKTFSEQFRSLLEASPKVAMMNDDGVQSINCQYTTDFSRGKNCYLVLSAWYDEDCMFGFQLNHSKGCIDNTFVNYSQLMYESIACENSYGCQWCQQCSESTSCIFGYDLKNCSDCILSAGLRNKRNCIWNKQYSQQEFTDLKASLQLDSCRSREELQKKFRSFIEKIPRKFANLMRCEDCTGDNLVRCKNAKKCFNFSDLYDCKFLTNGDIAKDSYDCNSTGRAELCYDCLTPDNSYRELFSLDCWKSQFILYSANCHSCQNLFGCANMKRKTYCILNKQYAKNEYEKLVPKIIEHMAKDKQWGNFFQPEVTRFAYNESAANEWYPLDKSEAVRRGFMWLDEHPGTRGKQTIGWSEVPDRMLEISKDGEFGKSRNVTKEVFSCANCSKNYRIASAEFSFYKEYEIPLPRVCPNCRHRARFQRINPKKLWKRACMKCGEEITTTYAPERPEIVYCEKCYMEALY